MKGKKADAIINDLKYQLFPNAVLNCVGHFITKCKSGEYDEAVIRKVNTITGYAWYSVHRLWTIWIL